MQAVADASIISNKTAVLELKTGTVFTYSKTLGEPIADRPMFHVADVVGNSRRVYAGMLNGFKKALYVDP